MVSDFKYEFNDGGTWQPVAFVDRVEDANNVTLWYIEVDNGTLHQVPNVPRGEENAHFRDRT